jgi:hypothetical protein
MPGENRYCRERVAKMFNAHAQTKWISNRNVGNVIGYESGMPDGFVFHRGKVICVECKAGFGAIQFGSPDGTSGWSAAQRSWWEHVARDTGTPYFIACWLYPSRERPKRVMQVETQLYLVPPECWLETEARARALGTKTIAAMPELERVHTRKEVAASICFAPHALVFEHSIWKIPETHALASVGWTRREQ